jgi:hypothetical protein
VTIVNNRCTKCGKKDIGETPQDERDGSQLCWCTDDDEPTDSPGTPERGTPNEGGDA